MQHRLFSRVSVRFARELLIPVRHCFKPYSPAFPVVKPYLISTVNDVPEGSPSILIRAALTASASTWLS